MPKTKTGSPVKAKSLSIKKGDQVRVLAGKDRGAEGRVIEARPAEGRVLVEGVNRVKRHTKVTQPTGRSATGGGIVTQEAPIPVSNVTLLVEVDGTKVPTRVGHKRVEVEKRRADGTTYTGYRSVRISTRTGEEI